MTKRRSSDETNREAVRLILADPTKFDGLALTWAKQWMVRHQVDAENREAPQPANQLELFRKP